jgi:alkylation response protein AidB-like acyl-CoA dehydrogenase
MLVRDLIESCGVCASAAAGIITLVVYLSLTSKRHRNRMNENTKKILTTKDEVEEGCRKVCAALVAAPVTDSEAECAEHMRAIVMAGHLRFKTLEEKPEVLLQANRHITASDNGALGTRFTVQYNLYGGSIVALGSDAQRQFLYDTQDKGELGCFAFTEIGAGVLSGAGVETTATYDNAKKTFTIHSPTESSKKYWISQV